MRLRTFSLAKIGYKNVEKREYLVSVQLFSAWKSGFPNPENKENRDIKLIGVCLYDFKFL